MIKPTAINATAYVATNTRCVSTCGIYFRDVNSIHHKRSAQSPKLNPSEFIDFNCRIMNNQNSSEIRESPAPEQKKKQAKPSPENQAANRIWDCGSCLYDSFELKALEKKLDSAIAARSLSMPHLSDRGGVPPPPPQKKPATSRISRSFQRLIRAVFFRPKNSSSGDYGRGVGGGFYGFYDRSGALSTIPEGSEFDGLSPEMRSLVTRTASERFTAATTVGISCS